MLGILKSLFGKSGADSRAELSADAIEQKIAEHNRQIAELKRKLPSASVQENVDKSAAWMAEMQVKINMARNKSDKDELARLDAEIKEASKKTDRIARHVEEIREQIVHEEDEIELLERALSAAK